MFILELTLRSWNHSEENKRRTLQRNDIAAAITRTDIFDFLVRPVNKQAVSHIMNLSGNQVAHSSHFAARFLRMLSAVIGLISEKSLGSLCKPFLGPTKLQTCESSQ